MPRRKKGSVPSYRHHKARDLAVVTINGRDIYLGKYGSADSKMKYSQLVRALEEQQREDPISALPVSSLQIDSHSTINELVVVYLKYAKDHYV